MSFLLLCSGAALILIGLRLEDAGRLRRVPRDAGMAVAWVGLGLVCAAAFIGTAGL